MTFNDIEIMERVKSGEHSLFEQLVLRYRPTLLRVAASKMADANWAEDVVQEALMAAFTARETFNANYSFRAWIWTILLNTCRRQLKARNRTAEVVRSSLTKADQALIPEPSTDDTGLAALLENESQQLLLAELGRLPEAQADAIRLRFYGGLKFQEIADAMQCSLRAAKLRVKNGLVTLSQRLKSHIED